MLFRSQHGVYTVNGLLYRNEDCVEFIICDFNRATFPLYYASDLFEILDYRLSKYLTEDLGEYFILNKKRNYSEYPTTIMFDIPSDPFFWDNFLNGKKENIDIVRNYAMLMDNEFPDDRLPQAEIVEKNWVRCSECYNIWQENSTDGIITCPSDGVRHNNPLWHGIPPMP